MRNYKNIIVSEGGYVFHAILVDNWVYYLPCWVASVEIDFDLIIANAPCTPLSAFTIEGIFYMRNCLMLPPANPNFDYSIWNTEVDDTSHINKRIMRDIPEPDMYDGTYDDPRIPRRIGFGKFWSLR